MHRATKIVATIGPASSSPEILAQMIAAGLDVVRLNFSHGTADDHRMRAERVREAARAAGREIALMADLQGPKIRVGKFEQGKIVLEAGQPFTLDANCELGDETHVGLDYKDLPRDLGQGDVLLLNDGLIVLTVTRVTGDLIHTIVKVGGELSNNKGINRQGGGLSAPALTSKDMEDIRTAMEIGADYVAVSFPKTATDMEMARQLANIAGTPYGIKPRMIAKIERAEVSDVANAVLDGTDAVMLPAETASGKYPVATIEAMAAICLEAEKSETVELDRDFLNRTFARIDQSIAMGVLFTAYHLGAKAIVALTESGATALWMSRHWSNAPIYALTSRVGSQRAMSLYRNVTPLQIDTCDDRDTALQQAIDMLVRKKLVTHGDQIVLTVGEPMGQVGGTNTLKIVRAGQYV